MIRVFLAGEGRGELGRWSEPAEYRSTSNRSDGVLAELLRRVRKDGWEIVGSVVWTKVRKYKSGGHRGAEEKNILGAALTAVEHGADVLVFTRDTDDDEERRKQVFSAREALSSDPSLGPEHVVGGVQHPCLEAWILVLHGKHRDAETLSKRKVLELAKTLLVDTEDAMVDVVRKCSIGELPSGNVADWIADAHRAFAASP